MVTSPDPSSSTASTARQSPVLAHAVATPRSADGMVDHDEGWKLWTDMVRYYPSGVHRRRLIRSWTDGLACSSVLDVGCGPGHLLDEIRQHRPELALVGIDNSTATIAENRQRLPWGRWEAVDITSDAIDERFDVVICSEVLEHTVDDAAALSNLVQMTGRYLLLTVPAGPIRPLEAGFGHLRHYTLRGLEIMVRDAGLDVVRSQAWGFPFMSLFKVASNLRPDATMSGFGDGAWSLPKKAVGTSLTALFYGNVVRRGPQLLLLAVRPGS